MSIQFDAIGIVVADMRAALDFYALLGARFHEGAESEGHVEWATDSGVRLMFDTRDVIKMLNPEWEPPVGGPGLGLAFACLSPLEVDATVENVRAAGHQVLREPFDAFWGQRYATVVDPDGNHIDLFATLSAA